MAAHPPPSPRKLGCVSHQLPNSQHSPREERGAHRSGRGQKLVPVSGVLPSFLRTAP